jgi:hypothetical protein
VQQKAIVYFHGMGDQERFGELSKLTNVMADHLGLGHDAVKVHTERFYDADGEIAYFQLTLPNSTATSDGEVTLRLYEVYWGPITAGKSNALNVLRWMLPQFMNAWNFLTTLGDWHGQPRMRRVSLHRMFFEGKGDGSTATYESLLERYEQFLKADARTADLVGWLKTQPRSPDVLRLARRWKRTLLWRVWSDFLVLLLLSALVLNVLASMVVLLGKSVSVIGELTKTVEGHGLIQLDGVFLFEFLGWVQGILGNAWLFQQFDALMKTIKPHPLALLIAMVVGAVCWYGLWLIQQFLQNFMGDVQLWTTYKENTANRATRSEILRLSERVFEHVLRSDCQEVTVVAHSLGSTVAHDALYRLGCKLDAAPDIDKPEIEKRFAKLKHFITAGSPIDKVFFFFESQRFGYPELEQMIQTQRGDVSKVPLVNMRWTNFFDQGDPISGTVFSANAAKGVQNKEGMTNTVVENIEVSNTHFPGPASHGGYFTHYKMLDRIANAIQGGPYNPPKDQETSRFAVPVFVGLLILPVLVLGTALDPGLLHLLGLSDSAVVIKGVFAQLMSAVFMLLLTGLIVSLVLPAHIKPATSRPTKNGRGGSILGIVLTAVALFGVISTSLIAPEQQRLFFAADNNAFQAALRTNQSVLERALGMDDLFLTGYGLLLIVLGVRNWSSTPGKLTLFLGVIAATLDLLENISLNSFVQHIPGVRIDQFMMFQILVALKFSTAALAVMSAAQTFKRWRLLQRGFVYSSGLLFFGTVMAALFPGVFWNSAIGWTSLVLFGLLATGVCLIGAWFFFWQETVNNAT